MTLLTLGDVVVSMPHCGRTDCSYRMYCAQGPAHLPHDVYHFGLILYARLLAINASPSDVRRLRAVLRLPEAAS